MVASLYLHIPFCAGACGYCDFYSVPVASEDPRLDRFVDNLLEVVLKNIQKYPLQGVPTVYLGGGTPSLLGPDRLERLLVPLLDALSSPPEEVSLEANPETLTPAFLRACVASGVNRLSVGCQTLHGGSRRAIGRLGSVRSLREAVELVAGTFPGTFSLDFISGLPLQTRETLVADLDFARASGASHVSLYSLTLAEGTPLARSARRGAVELPTEVEAEDLWIFGRDYLEGLGFPQYEVSNFARPGAECRHNLRYWRLEDHLGFGPAAVGTTVDEATQGARRLSWNPQAEPWCAAPPIEEPPSEEELIGRRDLIAETAIMGFRLSSGLPVDLFQGRFGVSPEFFFGKTLGSWRSRGLADPATPALTPEGLLLLDRFLLEALAELDGTYPRYEESLR